MELSSSNIKTFFTFSQTETPIKNSYFLTRNLFLYFGKRKLKFPYISGNAAFLYFIFKEVNFRARNAKKNRLIKSFHISRNFPAPGLKNFLYFRKKFRGVENQTKNLPRKNFLSLVTFL